MNNEQEHNVGLCQKGAFVIFQVLVYFVMIYAYALGNPEQMGQPLDAEKHPCGVGQTLSNYKYIYFTNPDRRYLWKTFCVQECPVLLPNQSEDDVSLQLSCHPNIFISQCQNRPAAIDAQYRVQYYDSTPYLNVCLPTKKLYLLEVQDGLKKPLIIRSLSDLYNGRVIIAATLFLCLLLNFVTIFLVHHFPKIIWVLLLLTLGSFGGAGQLGQLFIEKIQSNQVLPPQPTKEEIVGYVHSIYVDTEALMWMNYGFYGIAGFLFLVCLLKIKHLLRTPNNIKRAADLLELQFFQIIVFFSLAAIILTLFFVLWIWMAFYLITSSPINKHPNLLPFDYFVLDPLTVSLLGLLTFELLYVSSVVIASSQTVLQGVTRQIFQVRNQYNLNENSYQIVSTFGRFVRTTLGAVLTGELLIYPVQIIFLPISLIRLIFGYSVSNRVCSVNDRAYYRVFSANGNLGFFEAGMIQLIFDLTQERNNFKIHQGEFYSKLIAISMANMSILFTYACLIYSHYHTIISNPSLLILATYAFVYWISSLFGSIYGKALDAMIILRQEYLLQDQNQGVQQDVDDPHIAPIFIQLQLI